LVESEESVRKRFFLAGLAGAEAVPAIINDALHLKIMQRPDVTSFFRAT
jgi:hypothetical protein